MNIRILNLPRDMNRAQLIKLFTPYGKVNSCMLVMDQRTKQSKGFGFIEMENDEHAQAAISALHGSKQGKKTIRVKPKDAEENE